MGTLRFPKVHPAASPLCRMGPVRLSSCLVWTRTRVRSTARLSRRRHSWRARGLRTPEACGSGHGGAPGRAWCARWGAVAVAQQHDGLRHSQSRVATPRQLAADRPERPAPQFSDPCAACTGHTSPRMRAIAPRAPSEWALRLARAEASFRCARSVGGLPDYVVLSRVIFPPSTGRRAYRPVAAWQNLPARLWCDSIAAKPADATGPIAQMRSWHAACRPQPDVTGC
jgi:hypothetical protein